MSPVTNTRQFPNTVNFERDQDVPQWQHVPLKVPLFSTDELPLREPAPMQSYSIGQEISNSAPTAIAWSSPGLAKHHKCALAVLTANLVLSMWATEGKSQDESSWNRSLIVNDALREYYLSKLAEASYHAIPLMEERLRLRSRIRAFSWAPGLPGFDHACIVGTQLSYGQHIVAISNDDNHVALVTIHSPTSSNGTKKAWAAEVLLHFSVTPDSRGIFAMPSNFEGIMEQQRYISHLSWSPWIVENGRYRSMIMYATNHSVRARIATCEQGTVKVGDEIVYPDIEVRFNGPMKWSPRIEEEDKLRLALFTTTGLLCLTISPRDGSVVEKFAHDLDGRWDEISGAVWATAQSQTRLHVSSLASTLSSPTAVLEVSADRLVQIDSPNWRDQIENNLALFSVKNDLKGNCRARVWGLTISPLGDFIAASSSMHPSDMIEYGPPADRRSTVAINPLRQYGQLQKAFPSWNVSAESIIFTIKKLAGNLVEDAEKMPEFAEEVINELVQTYTYPQDTNPEGLSNIISPVPRNQGALVEAFKKDAFLNLHTLKNRYTILVYRACNITSSEDLPRALIAYRLAATVLQSPTSLSQSPFSAEIRTHHQQLMFLIASLANESTPDTIIPPSTETEARDGSLDSAPPPPTSPKTALAAPDTCDFCSAPIPFTDLASAACTAGHVFPRCGISFIAIQAPGITKYCGICSTPFLNDAFVAAQEAVAVRYAGLVDNDATTTASTEDVADSQDDDRHVENSQTTKTGGDQVDDDDDDDESITLARVLFLACDACIYCGGKFVG